MAVVQLILIGCLNYCPRPINTAQLRLYDFNLDISHQIDDKNNIYITGYLSNDKFRLNSDTAYGYSNKNANIKWKHNFNNKLYGVLTAGLDRYEYNVESTANPVNAYKLNFAVHQTDLKVDFNYYLNPKKHGEFWDQFDLLQSEPGAITNQTEADH